MSHYFTEEDRSLEDKPISVAFWIGSKSYQLSSTAGIFSKSGLDFGSRLLIETLLPHKAKSILDLGCGYGPIGIVLGSAWSVPVTMVDINRRAIRLAAKNARDNHVKADVYESDGFEKVRGVFDVIVTNPPIRAGKETLYRFFRDAKDHLAPDGALFFVIRKQQGAPSAIRFCEGVYDSVEVVEKKSGYFIVKCRK